MCLTALISKGVITMDKQMIEYYHNNGEMPDWIYYQVNGKSATENYLDMINKRDKEFREELLRQKEKEEMNKELEKEFETKLEDTLEKALDDLLKKFNSK